MKLVATFVVVSACVLVSAWFASPALAQEDLLDLYSDASAACLARSAAPMPPDQKITVCTAALPALDAIYARNPAPVQHETNVYRLQRAMVHIAIAGAHATLDKVRSSRVCAEIEEAWTEMTQIVDGESPSNYHEAFARARTSAIGPTAKCREEKGEPADAAPLPSRPL